MQTLAAFASCHITPRYVSWLNDPAVVSYSEQRHRRHTLKSCKAFVSRFEHGPSRLWAIETDGHHVGNVTTIADEPNGTVEINILIGEGRGQGVGTRACRQAIDAMLNAGYRKIWMETLSCNAPMLGVMKKLGLEPDGITRKHFVVGGIEVDAVRMCVFAPLRV